jgi:hypothetical protein
VPLASQWSTRVTLEEPRSSIRVDDGEPLALLEQRARVIDVRQELAWIAVSRLRSGGNTWIVNPGASPPSYIDPPVDTCGHTLAWACFSAMRA